MRKSILGLMTMLVILAFTSCSKEETVETSKLVGTWQCTYASQNGVTNTFGIGVYWTFDENNVLKTSFSLGHEEMFASYSYSVTGDRITINDMGTGTIQKLNSKVLSIEWDWDPNGYWETAHNDYVRVN